LAQVLLAFLRYLISNKAVISTEEVKSSDSVKNKKEVKSSDSVKNNTSTHKLKKKKKPVKI